jgi:hypothetical protein
MDWEIIGVIAEIAGAVTVVVTIAFLAVEVRNSRNATEAASVDTLATGFNTLHAQIITNQEFANIWLTGLADPDELDEAKRLRLTLQLQSYLNHYGALRRHYESGFLPKENWEPYVIGVAAIMNSPGGRQLSAGFSIPPAIVEEFNEYRDRSRQYSWLSNSDDEMA